MPDSNQPSTTSIPRPVTARRWWPLPLAARVHPAWWVLSALAILGLDFLTGPYIQVVILFVFPVALITWGNGPFWGSLLAAALPLVRLPFFFVWEVPSTWALEAADTAIDVAVLLALVQVIHYIARQQREIQVLEGLLPICGFCKRIRSGEGRWFQIERYITDRSEAVFSHTFCPDCARRHYGPLAE